jgi:hypothetical protein
MIGGQHRASCSAVHWPTVKRRFNAQRMTQPTQPPHKPITTRKRAQPPRLSTKLRKAIDAIAQQGVTQRKAADDAGMNERALSKALKKPHVAEALESQRALFVNDMDKLKGIAKALAIQTGIDLMRDSKDERIRAKMVEFFAGEAKQAAQVQVNVDARSGGYEFVRPGQQVVEIKANPAPRPAPTDS